MTCDKAGVQSKTTFIFKREKADLEQVSKIETRIFLQR
jgi:hypothetical protein